MMTPPNEHRHPDPHAPISWGAVIGFGMLGLLWPFLQLIGLSTAVGELPTVLTAFLIVSCVWLLGAGLGGVPRPVATLTLAGLIAGMLLIAVTVANGGLIAGGALMTLLAAAVEAGRLAALGALIGLGARLIQKARQPTSAPGRIDAGSRPDATGSVDAEPTPGTGLRKYRGGMTNTQLPAHHPSAHRRPILGLPILAIIGLAALAVPRVILHDLHIAEEGDPVTWVLAIGPWAVWIAAAVMKKVPHPFLTVLVTGVIFGAMLVITHQLLWGPAFGSNPPQIGTGPLAHVLPRIAGVVSGLFTGTMMGALGGLVAWGIQALTRRRA